MGMLYGIGTPRGKPSAGNCTFWQSLISSKVPLGEIGYGHESKGKAKERAVMKRSDSISDDTDSLLGLNGGHAGGGERARRP